MYTKIDLWCWTVKYYIQRSFFTSFDRYHKTCSKICIFFIR